VTVPFELDEGLVTPGDRVVAVDDDGSMVGWFEVVKLLDRPSQQRTRLVKLRATPETAPRIAGIRVQTGLLEAVDQAAPAATPDELIVCRCERVTAGEVRAAIRSGIRDVNELKGTLRVCMGACCGKNCPDHITALLREAGIAVDEKTAPTLRPLFLEVPMEVFAAGSEEAP
jgi:sarcosine oxidase, subunit alpha